MYLFVFGQHANAYNSVAAGQGQSSMLVVNEF